jgi:hypothetical protein
MYAWTQLTAPRRNLRKLSIFFSNLSNAFWENDAVQRTAQFLTSRALVRQHFHDRSLITHPPCQRLGTRSPALGVRAVPHSTYFPTLANGCPRFVGVVGVVGSWRPWRFISLRERSDKTPRHNLMPITISASPVTPTSYDDHSQRNSPEVAFCR